MTVFFSFYDLTILLHFMTLIRLKNVLMTKFQKVKVKPKIPTMKIAASVKGYLDVQLTTTV